MARARCRKCNKIVFERNKTCPHCGIHKPASPSSGIILIGAIPLIIMVIILGGIYSFFFGDNTEEKTVAIDANTFLQHSDKTLSEYKNEPQYKRKEIIESYTYYKKIDKLRASSFYNCLSEMSYKKPGDLKLKEVLGWCYDDFSKDPNVLNDRINFDKFFFHFSQWDGSYGPLERIIKNAMNDDSSYKHVDTTYVLMLNEQPPYAIVNTTFRGTNVYGGIVQNSTTAKVDIRTGEVISIIK
ncbi:hypothetical protein ID853_10820 [Xenorhabdus sp. Vera]|uniref:hypothetical protein n=1 Tax=Xenorhabdus koppenhoeferi TaxID=351659 RepID=UPI0019B1E674|nr:hypothetical protein [Xenorhabdus sp. Vera]MBD2811360.1 hypothetical protein [Xenorhabdus sp. Vera]